MALIHPCSQITFKADSIFHKILVAFDFITLDQKMPCASRGSPWKDSIIQNFTKHICV